MHKWLLLPIPFLSSSDSSLSGDESSEDVLLTSSKISDFCGSALTKLRHWYVRCPAASVARACTVTDR